MIRAVVILALGSLIGCSSLSLSGTAKPTENVGVSLGTILTPEGVRNTGSVNVKLF